MEGAFWPIQKGEANQLGLPGAPNPDPYNVFCAYLFLACNFTERDWRDVSLPLVGHVCCRRDRYSFGYG
jgi:hypothetical protein